MTAYRHYAGAARPCIAAATYRCVRALLLPQFVQRSVLCTAPALRAPAAATALTNGHKVRYRHLTKSCDFCT